jgi:RimJ/RimL family protein N-acetyltransferase
LNTIELINVLFKNQFKVIDGLPNSISLEQIDSFHSNDLAKNLTEYLSLCEKLSLERTSVLLNKRSDNFNYISNILMINGFEHYASKVEYIKNLNTIEVQNKKYNWKSLNDAELTEGDFKVYWEMCMKDSANAKSSLTMDQHLLSVESELGEKWRNSCRVFYIERTPIGITIPHIEPGTIDEGRIFYFGLFPEARGRNFASDLHYQSLQFLKEMGARYYIGATHLANTKMQKVFLRNNCTVKAYNEVFYKYFS